MKIYISLPISGRDESEAREEAARMEAAINCIGCEAVNPFKLYAGNNPTYADYICADLRALMDCEAVYFAPGWRESKGCKLEHSAAVIFGKGVLYQLPEEEEE